jgi:hypothetical protein
MRLNTTEGNYDHLRDALKGEAVYIVGSGPSLIGYDYSRLQGKTCIAINHSFRELLEVGIEPAYHVFLDQRFLNESGLDIDNLPFDSITSSNSAMSPRLKIKGGLSVIRALNHFSLEPKLGFYSPKSSILFAISSCLYMGVSEINLLGADCTMATKAQAIQIATENGNHDKVQQILKSNRAHYIHSTSGKYNHTKDSLEHNRIFEVMQSLYYEFEGKTEVPIFNCSKLSKIQTFQRKPLP